MTAKIQYLNPKNPYEARLIRLGEIECTYIAYCNDESCEPLYQGYEDEVSARGRAARLTRTTGYSHTTFRIQKDADGVWFTDYATL